jgi:hypothetical protein
MQPHAAYAAVPELWKMSTPGRNGMCLSGRCCCLRSSCRCVEELGSRVATTTVHSPLLSPRSRRRCLTLNTASRALISGIWAVGGLCTQSEISFTGPHGGKAVSSYTYRTQLPLKSAALLKRIPGRLTLGCVAVYHSTKISPPRRGTLQKSVGCLLR